MTSVLLIGCPSGSHAPVAPSTVEAPAPPAALLEAEAFHEAPSAPVIEPVPQQATLLAVGDIMMHAPQLRHAYDSRTGSYDFSDYFGLVAPILERGDWVIGNLETPVAGEDLDGFSGFPRFNAPVELLDELRDAHFTILSTANNHSLDRGRTGLFRTMENVRERGMIPIGTAASEEEGAEITVVSREGISLAFLSYTYGINGARQGSIPSYLVNFIDEPRMIEDIARAREKADVVVLSLHWGREYAREPDRAQRRLAKRLVAAGADVILGHHTHVLQPYEWIEAERRRGVVIYSLGNFISNQSSCHRPYTEFGAIFEVTFRRESPDHTVEIIGAEALPTWVFRPWTTHRRHYYVVPLAATLESRNGPQLQRGHYRKMQEYLEEMDEHLRSMLD